MVLPIFCFSQQNNIESILLQQITTQEKFQSINNSPEVLELYIRQIGNENQVFVSQLGMNLKLINQLGASNFISITNSGNNGLLTVEQIGHANQYSSFTRGDEIELTLLQEGEFNNIRQRLIGNELTYTIIQKGSHNEIQHYNESISSALIVSQQGNDMRLIIKTNN